MSWWKSRWSRLRLVKAPTAKAVPLTRCQRQRVRGNLHRDDAAPPARPSPRTGPAGRVPPAWSARWAPPRPSIRVCTVPTRPGRRAVRAERRLQQVAGRGLAGRAGHPDHVEPRAGVAVDHGGDGAETPGAARRDHHDGHAQVGVPQQPGADGIGEHAPRPPRRPPRRRWRRAPGDPAMAANRSPGRTSWARRVMPVMRVAASRGRDAVRADPGARCDLADTRPGGVPRPQRRAGGPPRGGRARRGGCSHAGHVTVPDSTQRPDSTHAARFDAAARSDPATPPDAAALPDVEVVDRRLGRRRRHGARPASRRRRRPGTAARRWWFRRLPPFGSSSMIATTYCGLSAGTMPANVEVIAVCE